MPFIDFKEVKRTVSIEQAASILNLTLKPSGSQQRGPCPACGDKDPRILAITPSRGLFYCFSSKQGGDCLALVQHITGLDVQDAAAYLSPTGAAHNSPVPEQKKAAATKKEVEFNPAAFAAKLVFSDEVAALGLTEQDAVRLGIGFTRGRVYFPMKDDTGFIAGFIGYADGELKMPPKWRHQNKVVKLRA